MIAISLRFDDNIRHSVDVRLITLQRLYCFWSFLMTVFMNAKFGKLKSDRGAASSQD